MSKDSGPPPRTEERPEPGAEGETSSAPAPGSGTPDSTVEFVVRLPEATLSRLRTALAVRGMAQEIAGLPELFLARLLKCIDEGKREHTFVIRKDPH